MYLQCQLIEYISSWLFWEHIDKFHPGQLFIKGNIKHFVIWETCLKLDDLVLYFVPWKIRIDTQVYTFGLNIEKTYRRNHIFKINWLLHLYNVCFVELLLHGYRLTGKPLCHVHHGYWKFLSKRRLMKNIQNLPLAFDEILSKWGGFHMA